MISVCAIHSNNAVAKMEISRYDNICAILVASETKWYWQQKKKPKEVIEKQNHFFVCFHIFQPKQGKILYWNYGWWSYSIVSIEKNQFSQYFEHTTLVCVHNYSGNSSGNATAFSISAPLYTYLHQICLALAFKFKYICKKVFFPYFFPAAAVRSLFSPREQKKLLFFLFAFWLPLLNCSHATPSHRHAFLFSITFHIILFKFERVNKKKNNEKIRIGDMGLRCKRLESREN